MSAAVSQRRRTARHAADMPLSNTGRAEPDEHQHVSSEDSVPSDNQPEDFTSPKRRLVSIRILPHRAGEDASLSSDKLAQAILEQANDPQSKLRTTPGLEGILGAFLAPRGIDPGLFPLPRRKF